VQLLSLAFPPLPGLRARSYTSPRGAPRSPRPGRRRTARRKGRGRRPTSPRRRRSPRGLESPGPARPGPLGPP
ncbi:hypothetical protein NGA_2074600, partial [Nannochloropsis gaditana CCMP526]|uniref:uncharacterized protein n=1 Tax=Nannochloropsis gaditana (strain CCMP526) TaxID=1093141 RepID=UPI00029F5E88